VKNRTPRKAAAQLGANLPGGPAKGLEEFSRTSPQGILQNPEKGFEGQVARSPTAPDPFRMAGSRSIPEAEQMTASQEQKKKDQLRQQARGSSQNKYISQYMEGSDTGDSFQAYVQAGGDPRELISSLVQAIQKSGSTAWQRRETKLRSIQQLRSYLESNEYGVRK
jgi:hypothetical protein